MVGVTSLWKTTFPNLLSLTNRPRPRSSRSQRGSGVAVGRADRLFALYLETQGTCAQPKANGAGSVPSQHGVQSHTSFLFP